MANIHSTKDNVIDSIVESHLRKSAVAEGKAFQKSEDVHYELASKLNQLRNEKNINDIVTVEKLYLMHAQKSANSKGERSSLNEGLRRIGEAEQSLAAVQNKDTYRVRLQTASLKELDKEGLPRDSFRQFINSQITSIRNQERSPLSKAEKAVLEARISNLRAANEIYKGMQREALSKPEPSKEQDTDNDFKTALQKAAQKAFPDNEEARKQFIDYATAQKEIISRTKETEKRIESPKKHHDGPER